MSRLDAVEFPGFGDRRGWLTVHTLSEFVFCPRAGVLAYAQQQMDEIDEPPPRFNLDYLPDYSLALIEQALEHQLRDLRRLGIRFAAALIALGWMFYDGLWLWMLPVAAVFATLSWRFADRLQSVMVLVSRRRSAREALDRQPIEDSDQMQRVNWWELLKAGYESEVYQHVLEDEDLKLAGRPWRVLVRGSLRIPVVMALPPNSRQAPTPGPQQCARSAAYCRLLTTCVGGESPFGIVLFGNSYEGWTVPNTPQQQAEFDLVIARARELFESLTCDDEAARPDSTSVCNGCQHGEPVTVEQGASRIAGSAIHGATGRDGQQYHSPCGDRFRWRPPHHKARALGLVK
ncbi:MAG: hypothetical protein KF708_06995 [Pirellulales bacterium]|nr:hypothetical protein [Pirellulales bacterium]